MTTSNDQLASRLIAELLDDPESFDQKGSANALLKTFLRGLPIEHLAPLLRNSNVEVVKRAIWIASELSDAASPFLADAIRLSNHGDTYIKCYALDVITVNTKDTRQEEFARVVERLADTDVVVAYKAVRLVAHATDGQLAASKKVFEREPLSPHISGLSTLLQLPSSNPKELALMITARDSLQKKYGLAAAERAYGLFPHLIELAALSSDESIKKEAAAMIKVHQAGPNKQKNRTSKH